MQFEIPINACEHMIICDQVLRMHLAWVLSSSPSANRFSDSCNLQITTLLYLPSMKSKISSLCESN